MTATINASTTAGVVITPDNSGAVALQNNGTTALTLDASGRPLTPLRPGFRASLSTSTAFADGAVIVFNTTSGAGTGNFNTGSNYSTSTGTFTAPVAGLYTFSTCILYSGLAGGTQVDSQIQLNGVSQVNFGRYMYQANYSGFGGYCEVRATSIAYLSAGDTVRVINNSGGSKTAYGADSSWTWFAGYLVG